LRHSHDMARTYQRINQSRHVLWDLQLRVAEHLHPQELRRAVDRSQHRYEPALGAPTSEPAPATITPPLGDGSAPPNGGAP